MEAKEFFTNLLGVRAPWIVQRVDYDLARSRVDLYLTYNSKEWVDERTGEVFPVYDLRQERQWRHLDVMQYQTYLHCRTPRIKLPNTGEIVSCPVPWADEGERHSLLFEDRVIETLHATGTQTRAGELMRVSYEKVNRIMHRAVERGLGRRKLEDEGCPIPFLHVDEKSYRRGRHYITVLSDSTGKRVLNVEPGKTVEACKCLLEQTLTEDQRKRVEAVCTDMYPAFAVAIRQSCPQAEVVYDKFHLVQCLNHAIDQVRKEEMKIHPGLLKHARYVLLKHRRNFTVEQRARFRAINQANLQAAKAWKMRENFLGLYDCLSVEEAEAYLTRWMEQIMHSAVKAIRRIAHKFRQVKREILNAVKYRLTNAIAEGMNSKIQKLNCLAQGYRNFANLKAAILFFNGKLNLLSHC